MNAFNRVQKIYENIKFRLRHRHERMIGVDFYDGMSAEELGFDSKLVSDCAPSGGASLNKILRDLKITPSDSICDIGCGKGSAMRTMLDFPFKQVDGIELSPQVAGIAISNFLKLNFSRVNIYAIDATKFECYGRYNFFYLYNPFPDLIVFKCLQRINAQRNQDDEIIIIYNNPKAHQQVEACGFKKIAEYPEEWGNGIFIYTNKICKSRISQKNQPDQK